MQMCIWSKGFSSQPCRFANFTNPVYRTNPILRLNLFCTFWVHTYVLQSYLNPWSNGGVNNYLTSEQGCPSHNSAICHLILMFQTNVFKIPSFSFIFPPSPKNLYLPFPHYAWYTLGQINFWIWITILKTLGFSVWECGWCTLIYHWGIFLSGLPL